MKKLLSIVLCLLLAVSVMAMPMAVSAAEEKFTMIDEEICLSVEGVEAGANEIAPCIAYTTTIYEFNPEEFGVYTITADDENALVSAYVGSIHFIPIDVVGTDNQVSIEFTSGVSMMIGVSNTDACTLTIEKTGDVVIEKTMDWDIYENVYDVKPFETEFDGTGMTNVDIYADGVVNTAVLGDDGYYHLDSKNGEILYANLNDVKMSFVDIIDRTKLSAVFYDEDGKVVAKNDYTYAVIEYIDSAAQIDSGEKIIYLYPLTVDLIEMYKNVGEAGDWYGRDGWVGGYEDDAWMFACYYVAGSGSTGIPSTSVTVPTGNDFTPVYVSVATMALMACVVVFARKKMYN